jgi:hypothetical protein
VHCAVVLHTPPIVPIGGRDAGSRGEVGGDGGAGSRGEVGGDGGAGSRGEKGNGDGSARYDNIIGVDLVQ